MTHSVPLTWVLGGHALAPLGTAIPPRSPSPRMTSHPPTHLLLAPLHASLPPCSPDLLMGLSCALAIIGVNLLLRRLRHGTYTLDGSFATVGKGWASLHMNKQGKKPSKIRQ